MAVKGIPYKLKDESLYTSDFGATANFSLSLRPPSDLAASAINQILECIGAEQRESGPTICSERGLITYRRFRFIRSNGSSMTVIAPDRTKIITQAQCIWDVLKGTNHKPVCVQLEGEQHSNVLDDLVTGDREGDDTGPPLKPPSDAGRNRFFYSGSMKNYLSDANYGAKLVLSFKMDTDEDQAPYTGLSEEIEGCIDEIIDASVCGGSQNPRDYRRFIPTILTTIETSQDGQLDSESIIPQSLTIPCAENTPEKIKECGAAIANKAFVQCLRYEGENNSRLHKLLTT